MSPDPLVKDFSYPADLKPSGGQSDTLLGFWLSFSIRTNQPEAQTLLNIRLYKKKKAENLGQNRNCKYLLISYFSFTSTNLS